MPLAIVAVVDACIVMTDRGTAGCTNRTADQRTFASTRQSADASSASTADEGTLAGPDAMMLIGVIPMVLRRGSRYRKRK